MTSTGGGFEGDTLTLPFHQYGATLEATLKDGRLEGRYSRGSRSALPFKAARSSRRPTPRLEAPSIAGLWTIAASKSSKGEKAWRFLVRQTGPDVSAAILRVDGDTGTLTDAGVMARSC